MTEQHNYGDGKSYQVNQPQGPTVVGDGNQVEIYYAAPPPGRPRNEQILWEAVRDEVRDRLVQSLHNQVLINLGKDAQPQQVNSRRPWDWEVKIGPGVKALTGDLPEEWDIGEIFNQANRKLLILGAPGSGKTTTLLDLGRELLAAAATDANAPIPVLVNLSSWKEDEQSMADWLREEVRVKYGVSAKLGQQWIEEKALLPLLDGLDEVAAERQEVCAQRINEWLASELRPVAVVVCSRTEEYGLYQTNLELGGAICLKPLTLAQMQDYLRGLGQEDLAAALETDEGLRDLVEAPLLLGMAVLAFEGEGMDQWRGLTTEQDRLIWLLDAYVVTRLQKEYEGKAYKAGKVPDAQQTRQWLSWLAKLMARQSQTEFLIEGLQPRETLTNLAAKRQYYIFFLLIIPSIIGAPFLGALLLLLESQSNYSGVNGRKRVRGGSIG
ncbi:MAG: NACHT domain-containing protein, partial [Prochlorothrix sp.]